MGDEMVGQFLSHAEVMARVEEDREVRAKIRAGFERLGKWCGADARELMVIYMLERSAGMDQKRSVLRTLALV